MSSVARRVARNRARLTPAQMSRWAPPPFPAAPPKHVVRVTPTAPGIGVPADVEVMTAAGATLTAEVRVDGETVATDAAVTLEPEPAPAAGVAEVVPERPRDPGIRRKSPPPLHMVVAMMGLALAGTVAEPPRRRAPAAHCACGVVYRAGDLHCVSCGRSRP